jgi:hypothetical protein
MSERYTASRLRANLYRLLDRVAETGIPLEIERKGRILRVEAVTGVDRIACLRPHPEAIREDLESLVDVDWSGEWEP